MGLYKRGATWWATYTNASGEYIRQSTKKKDKVAADLVLREWERSAADPNYAASKTYHLGDALADFLRYAASRVKAGELSARTLAFYQEKAGHITRVFEGEEEYVALPLAMLTARHVDDYIVTRRAEGLAAHSIKKELTTLRVALKMALRHGRWAGSLDAVMPARFEPRYRPRTRSLSEEEVRKLLRQLEPHRAAHVAFIVATGASWGESVRAQRGDVFTDFVHIRGTKNEYRDRAVPRVGIMESLLTVALTNTAGDRPLYSKWASRNRDIIRACERAGIPACSPNDLRRTFTHWLRQAGVPLELVSPAMGHADTRMVERVYGKRSTEELVASFRKFCAKSVREPLEQNGLDRLNGVIDDRKWPDFTEILAPAPGIEPGTHGLTGSPTLRLVKRKQKEIEVVAPKESKIVRKLYDPKRPMQITRSRRKASY